MSSDYPLDNTKRNSFTFSIIVNVDSDIFTVASQKAASIDMEIIERSEERNDNEVNVGKDLNKIRWSQVLWNGTGFCRGIRSLSLVGKIIVRPSVVCESYEIESPILINRHVCTAEHCSALCSCSNIFPLRKSGHFCSEGMKM